MSEMVERVARAIAAVTMDDPDYDWTCFVGEARAAIEAMREPTPGMVGAANRNNHPRDIDTWQTMIDAALGEQR